MPDQPRTHWAFRIAISLGLILGVGWGFLLGVILVRLNTLFLLIGMLLTALPIAFFGGAMVAFAFRRLIPNWPRAAGLLVILIFVAAGMPLGLAYGVIEQQLDPVDLVSRTGALIWDLEWLFAIVGLVGGTWTGWTRPFTGRAGNFVLSIAAPPLALVKFIASIPIRLLNFIATFLENVGRGFLWLPSLLVKAVAGTSANLQQSWNRLRTGPAPTRRRRRRRPPAESRSSRSRARLPLPELPSSQRGNHNDGPRIVDVVEDRCPYCFDVVKRNDPRGVMICEVCGTPHHADCWAITGKCQVPHLNT